MSKTIWMRSSSQSASKSFFASRGLRCATLGAENERQAAASPRRWWAHPGIIPTHLGSPLRHPTGVSVAALSSPARTGRAMLAVYAPNSSPPCCLGRLNLWIFGLDIRLV